MDALHPFIAHNSTPSIATNPLPARFTIVADIITGPDAIYWLDALWRLAAIMTVIILTVLIASAPFTAHWDPGEREDDQSPR